jgi:hypothetical protein
LNEVPEVWSLCVEICGLKNHVVCFLLTETAMQGVGWLLQMLLGKWETLALDPE